MPDLNVATGAHNWKSPNGAAQIYADPKVAATEIDGGSLDIRGDVRPVIGCVMGVGDELAIGDLAEGIALHLWQRERRPRCSSFRRRAFGPLAGLAFLTFLLFALGFLAGQPLALFLFARLSFGLFSGRLFCGLLLGLGGFSRLNLGQLAATATPAARGEQECSRNGRDTHDLSHGSSPRVSAGLVPGQSLMP